MHTQAFMGLLAVLLATGAPVWAEATLSGVVSMNRERGEPVAGVQVSAQGANPRTTGQDGRFLLHFHEGRPGQDVRVQVKRHGWEVVNDILLDQRLPGDAMARPLEIILCRATEREQWVADFYRLKGSQAVEASYRVKLAALEARQSSTAQERDRLQRERDQALEQVQEWARRSAARPSAEAAGVYRDALRLFLDGKADQSLVLLSEERLEEEAREGQAKIEQAVQGWLLKGQLHSTKLEFDAASRSFEQAVKFAPGSFEAWFQFAYFHQEVNRFVHARRGYEQAELLARNGPSVDDLAMTLNNLGVLSRAENRNDQARKQFEEALELYRGLVKTNPAVNLPYVAMTLNNMGLLSSAENRNDEARKQFEEALELFRGVAKTNPAAYQTYVAITLNNLGLLSSAENRNDQARKQFEEALEIRRGLAKTNPSVFLPEVAMTLNNLGVVSRAENRSEQARKQYEEALEIRRSLAKNNPAVHLPYVASTLNNLGVLSSSENRIEQARKQYEEALEIRRSLAKSESAAYLPDVAKTIYNLGLLSSAENRSDQARKHFEEALEIFRMFAESAPDVYGPLLRKVESNILSLPQ